MLCRNVKLLLQWYLLFYLTKTVVFVYLTISLPAFTMQVLHYTKTINKCMVKIELHKMCLFQNACEGLSQCTLKSALTRKKSVLRGMETTVKLRTEQPDFHRTIHFNTGTSLARNTPWGYRFAFSWWDYICTGIN